MGIKIYGLQLGTFPMPMAALFNPTLGREPERFDGDVIDGMYRCPALSYVIDHPDAGLILFETGIAPTWASEWLPDWLQMLNLDAITREVCLEAVLQQRNLAPEDFSHVIQGHLHADHAGGLRLFEDAGATIVVHEDEWRHVVTNVADADEFFIRADWNFVSRAPQMLMYGDQEIAKDLWCISLPGHTPGTMGILARLDQTGWVLLTSDAMFFHDTLGPPPANSPIDMDTEAWNHSIDKIATIAADRDAFLLPGHDTTGAQFVDGVRGAKQIELAPGSVYE
ncbi:MAG: N-acyl homoserine lactonase family protein [Chloroflexi bacterium]|nr:N-acyl homoserine lactonase family protein [Chloroflexota bacterium]MYC00515.1 N-acyl homoserine lactonase family protein [Chloroflexota bacterium]